MPMLLSRNLRRPQVACTLLVSLGLLLSGCSHRSNSPTPAAIVPAPTPLTEVHPVTDTYVGPNGPVSVTENYRWLEVGDDPVVQDWSDKQNLRARSYIGGLQKRQYAALPKRRAVSATPRPTLHDYYPQAQRPNGLFATAYATGKQQKYLVLLPSASSPERARTIYDPNIADPFGRIAIVLISPSQSGKYVGVADARNGTEDGTLHIFETATGRELPDRIARVTYPSAGGSIAWSGDDSGFFYTRYPQPGERPAGDEYNYQQVYYHRLGRPVSDDAYALGKDFPRIAATGLRTSQDGKYTLADVYYGDGGEQAFYLHQPTGKWDKIAASQDGIVGARFGSDDTLYLVSQRKGSQGEANGSVLRLPAGDSRLADAKMIVPPGATAINGIITTAHLLYVFYIDGGPTRLTTFDYDGLHGRDVPIPPMSSVDNVVCTTGDTIVYQLQSYTQRQSMMQYTPGQAPLALGKLLPHVNIDYGDIVAQREFAVSKDGTRIPMTVMMLRGTHPDGNNPTVITGYGGYGHSQTPHFDFKTSLWCHAGGIYVYTNIRGGGEYGENWHRAGNLLNKQNVFDDFAACAKYLIDQGYTRPAKLAAIGASNGGLLMGAQITQHPDLYKCVLSNVGIYDTLRVELSPNGLENTTEYGTVKNPAQFAAMYAYSPYHHVREGVHYPDVLMMTGDNDGRVDPMQSRKMMARLQAVAAAGSTLLLRTSAATGHGPGSPIKERQLELADQQSFLIQELGMDPARFAIPEAK